jgi:hypothetical protein
MPLNAFGINEHIDASKNTEEAALIFVGAVIGMGIMVLIECLEVKTNAK